VNVLKNTLKKYFVSEDTNTISMGAVGITLLGVLISLIMMKEMWPLSVDDLMKIAVSVPALLATLGWYRRAGKKTKE